MSRNAWIILGVAVAALAGFLIFNATSGDGDSTTTTSVAGDTSTSGMEETTTTGAEETTTTGSSEADYGDPVTLALGHPFPEQHPIHQGALLPYAEAVNEATNGTITIEFHAGGSLAAAPATYENTVIGGQDLGWALQGYHAGVFPVTEVVEQPFQFESAMQATQTLWSLYDSYPELQAEYSDTQLLGLWTHDIGDLWTKDQKVETLEDVEGLTLRFPTRIMGQVIEDMGGSPVGMPAPEIFDALSTGVIDGLMIAVSGLQSFQLYPELNYWAVCDCYVAAQYLVMNLDEFNALTPDAQQVMIELGREYSLVAAQVYDDAYANVSQIALDEGLEQYVLPAEELARWKEVGQGVTDQWIAEQEANGVPAQAMYDDMQTIKQGFAG